MTQFEFFFYTLLFALVQGQGQGPVNRNLYSRRWVRERTRMASNVSQGVEGQAPLDRSLHVQHGFPEQHQNQTQEQAAANQNLNGQRGFPERHQNQVSSGVPLEGEPSPVSENVHPVTWQDLLAVNNVSSLSSFISLLVTRDGQPVRDEDLFSPEETPDGKRVIAGSEDVMASPDECSPRNISVRLELDHSDPAIVYYPECTQVQRCGGCTPDPFLDCVPRYKEIVVLSVLKARYPFPGALSMEIEGFASVRVERHLTCQVSCNLKREDCAGPNSIYFQEQCRCQCKTYVPCTNGKVWSEESCQCRCRNELPCCGPRQEGNDRGCPLFFDHTYCECTLKQSMGDINVSQAEMVAWLTSRRSRCPGGLGPLFTVPGVADNTTTHPTPPATTTSSPTTTEASCSHINCPRSMVSMMTLSGRCMCQLPQGRGRRSPLV